MKHRFLIMTLASVMLASSIGTTALINKPQMVQAVNYYNHFHYVETTKDVKVYRAYHTSHGTRTKFAYIMKKGSRVYIRARGVVWGWTIGKKYHYCTFKDTNDHSWFTRPHSFKAYLNGTTFQNKSGVKATINSLTNVKDSKGNSYSIADINITNKGYSSIYPADWVSLKVALLSVNPKKIKIHDSDILFENADNFPTDTKWESLIKAGQKKLGHNDSTHCAAVYSFKDKSKSTNTIYMMPLGLNNMKVATIHAKSDSLN